jgi:RimJ/RimL family protein N-acetyltransferase
MTEQVAEVAVWVDDAWQRRGVGGLLLREILASLTQQGYAEGVGFVEPSNIAARRLIERVSPNATRELDDDSIKVRMPLSTIQMGDRQETTRWGSAPVAT